MRAVALAGCAVWLVACTQAPPSVPIPPPVPIPTPPSPLPDDRFACGTFFSEDCQRLSDRRCVEHQTIEAYFPGITFQTRETSVGRLREFIRTGMHTEDTFQGYTCFNYVNRACPKSDAFVLASVLGEPKVWGSDGELIARVFDREYGLGNDPAIDPYCLFTYIGPPEFEACAWDAWEPVLHPTQTCLDTYFERFPAFCDHSICTEDFESQCCDGPEWGPL